MLSTYWVVLHPSYLQKVFCLIIFINEIYSFTIPSENSWAPGDGAPWAELKSGELLSADHQQNTDIWCRFTCRLQFWIMTGIFCSWDRSIFQYQTMCKTSAELGLVYKTFVNKHLWNSSAAPRKTNCIHCLGNAGFSSGSLTRLSFPHNQKHTSLETFFPSESRAALPDEACWWAP